MVKKFCVLEHTTMKIVVISAHPDDLEIGCVGTLKKFQDQGATIISVVTVRPSAEVNSQRSRSVVEDELHASYTMTGFDLRIFDTDLHDNGRPNLQVDNVTMTKLSYLIDNCDLAIIPNSEDYHQDHRATNHLAWPLLQKKAKEVWTMNSWPYCYQYRSNPNIYHGIDWHAKQQVLSCYKSYISQDNLDQIQAINCVNGNKAGVPHAESFNLLYKYVR